MCFYFAPLFFDNATQLPLHRFESVMDDFFKRLVRAVVHLSLVRDEFVTARDGHIDAAAVWISFLMRVIRLLDGHIAAVDVVAKFFESRRIIQNEIIDLVRLFQTPVRDLNGQLHT